MILLYDSECGFCRWAVAWAIDRDVGGVLMPVPIGSPYGADLLADIEPAERLASMHLIRDDGARCSGGAALRGVLEVLPSERALAYLAGLSPRATDAGYAFVATNRGKFSRLISIRAKQRADLTLLALQSTNAGRRMKQR